MKISMLILSLFMGLLNEEPELAVPIENPLVVEKTDYELSTSDQIHIIYTIDPKYDVTFESSDPSIASVSSSGLITGLKAGSVTIKLKTMVEETVFDASVNVLVKGIEGEIKFAQSEFYLIRDLYVDLEYSVSEALKDQTITWSSSDPTVARVENGRVYGLKIGSTTVRAMISDIIAEIYIEVTLPLKEIEFNPENLSLSLDESASIPPLIYIPFDTTSSRGAVYSSMDESIVSIDGDQLIAVGVGETEIIARIGSIETRLSVIVLPKKSPSGSDILNFKIDRVDGNQMVLKIDDISRFKSKSFLLQLPETEIIEFIKEQEDAHVMIVLDDVLLKNSMSNLESFNVKTSILDLLTDRQLTVHLTNQKNYPLAIYHFNRPSKKDFNLRFSLDEVSESSSLYPHIGTKSFRLRFYNDFDYEFQFELDADRLNSNFSQYHFIYKNVNTNLEDTKQDVSVDKHNRISFMVDGNDYIITFSRIALSNNSTVIYVLLGILLLVGTGFGSYYLKNMKKKQ